MYCVSQQIIINMSCAVVVRSSRNVKKIYKKKKIIDKKKPIQCTLADKR